MINRKGLSHYLKSGLLDRWDLLLAICGGGWFLKDRMIGIWTLWVRPTWSWQGLPLKMLESIYLVVGLCVICVALCVLTIDPEEQLLRAFFFLVGVSFLLSLPLNFLDTSFHPSMIIQVPINLLEDAVFFSIFVLGFAYLKNEVLQALIVTIIGATVCFGVGKLASSLYIDWYFVWTQLRGLTFYLSLWGAAVLGNFLSGNGYEGLSNSVLIPIVVHPGFPFEILTALVGFDNLALRVGILSYTLANLFEVILLISFAPFLAWIATSYHRWAYGPE